MESGGFLRRQQGSSLYWLLFIVSVDFNQKQTGWYSDATT